MWYKYCPDCGKRSPVWIDSIGVQRLMCCEQAVDIRQAERELKRTSNGGRKGKWRMERGEKIEEK